MNFSPKDLLRPIDSLLQIIKEAVVDKDKQIEAITKLTEIRLQTQHSVLTQSTVPWVDATVKLIYAVVALAAPIGTFAITAFGLYCHYKGIKIDPQTHLLIDSAFPAWRGMRHLEKKAGVAVPQPRPRPEDDDEYIPPRRHWGPRP